MRAIYVRPAAADVNRRRGRDWPDRPRRFRLGGAGTDDREDAMTVTDRRGLMLSNATADCALALDEALDDALAFRGNPIARIDAVLAANPDFVMGHVFRAGLLTQEMETRIYGTMVGSVEAAERLWDRATARERDPIRPVRAWVAEIGRASCRESGG